MKHLWIELAYIAENQSVYFEKINYPHGTIRSVHEVIQQSGILNQFPETHWETHGVGIFGKVCTLETQVSAGDRIEIYRPLRIDPKSRRRIKSKSKTASHLKKRINPSK